MDTSGKFVLHMIGHGHIDPTWLWRWTEGYEEVRATFRSALDRMRETPDFRFTASSACFYQWVLESDPEMFAEIRGRVREGRWSTRRYEAAALAGLTGPVLKVCRHSNGSSAHPQTRR